MKTELHVKDCDFVRIGSSMASWVGKTIYLVVTGLTTKDFSFSKRENELVTKPHEIHLFYDRSEMEQFAQKSNGIECVSFVTSKIKEALDLMKIK